VVTLQSWALGREGEVVEELIPEFERRNPGIRVEVQQIPWAAAHEKLLTAYVGEAAPDVAQVGNTWVPELVALGALERLDGWVARSAVVEWEGYFPGIWDTNVIGGGVYGIPWYVDTRLLFYRTDLLAEVGFAGPPETWAEWREAMRRIKKEVGEGRYAVLLETNDWRPPVILGLSMGSPLLRDDDRYGAFRGAAFREAFEFYVSLFREGLAPAVSHNQVPNVYQAFADGYISMFITGPWNIGEFRRRLPPEMQDRWMTAPMPGPNGPASGRSVAGGASLVVFRASAHKAEAWRLIEYLSEPEQQLRFYALTGDLPARREAWQDPALAGNPHARAFWEQLQRVAPVPKVPEWEQIATKVMQYAEGAVLGRLSTDAALAALDHDVDRILEKRRWMLARGVAAAR
jgi:multiple sugar transport system substrate-binding protein